MNNRCGKCLPSVRGRVIHPQLQARINNNMTANFMEAVDYFTAPCRDNWMACTEYFIWKRGVQYDFGACMCANI
jgi:hypothetical protein